MPQSSSGCISYPSRGVVLRAACAGIPNGALAVLLHFFLSPDNEDEMGFGVVGLGGISVLWSGYTFVLGLLIVFQSNQAYSRFWYVANTVAEIRGSWFNAISSLVSFCSADDDMFEDVEHFQYLIGRLCSMLYCAALQQAYRISDDSALEILSVEGIDASKLSYLSTSQHKCEVLVQWLQQLVVKTHRQGILEVPSTLLSRVFQELAHGAALLNRVRNPENAVFASPYTQASSLMLVVHWIVTPFAASQCLQSPWWAGILSFAVVSAFWGLMFVARELLLPLGMELDCMPLQGNMRQFNESLLALVHPTTQSPPTYHPEQALPHLDPLVEEDAQNYSKEEAQNDSKEQDNSKTSSNSSGPPPGPEMRPEPAAFASIPENKEQSGSGSWPARGVDHATKLPPIPSNAAAQGRPQDRDMALSNPGNPAARHVPGKKRRRSLAGRTKKNWTLATVAKMRNKWQGVESSLQSEESSFADSSMLSSLSGSSEPTQGTGSEILTNSRNMESLWNQQAANNMGPKARSQSGNKDSEIGVRC